MTAIAPAEPAAQPVPVAEPRNRALFAATFGLWGASALVLATTLLRGKISALYLGPAGIGLIAQLNYLANLSTNFAALGLSNGCIKLLAEARAQGDIQAERRVRGIVFALPVTIGLVIALAIAVAAKPISGILFDSESHAVAIIVAATSIPLAMAAGSFSISLQGSGNMRRLAAVNSVSAVLTTVLVVSLVIAFGLDGAIAGVTLTSLVVLLSFVAYEPRFRDQMDLNPRRLLHKPTLRAIYAFGVASLILSVASTALELGVRTAIVHRLGITSNGLYQPVMLLSTQVFLALITALSTYLFPRLTELYTSGHHEHAAREVNEGLRLVLAVVVPTVIAVVTFAPILLTLMFSQSFEAAARPLNIQMLGDVFRALGWIFGAVLLPLGMIRPWLWIGLATIVMQAAASLALLTSFGLEGAAAGYTVGWITGVVLTVWVVDRYTSFRVDRRSMVFSIAAVIATTAAVAAAYGGTMTKIVVAVIALLGWWAVTLRRETFAPLRARFGGSG